MYGKLFAQMYDGTLGTKGPWQALVTFQQLIILADKKGVVDLTPEALSRRTTIPLDVISIGLAELEKLDPQSRSSAEGGRRIVRLSKNRSWGWQIVNYDHYRKIRSEEERREYHKLYARKRRSKKAVNQNVNTSTSDQHSQPIAVCSTQDAVRTKKRTTATAPSGADILGRLNGKKTSPAKPESEFAFMADLRPIWQKIYGGELPPGSAKRLKPSVEKHGIDETLRRFRIYCESTPPPFASVLKFVSTFGSWDKPNSPPNGLAPGQEVTVDELFAACSMGGLFSALNQKDLDERCAALADTGEFTADEIAALTRINLAFCSNASQRNDRAGLKRHIASLVFLQPAPQQERQNRANGKGHRIAKRAVSW